MLRLIIDLRLTAAEFEEAERLLAELKGTNAIHGRVGILQLERHSMVLDTRGIEAELADLPEVLRSTVTRLKAQEIGDQAEVRGRRSITCSGWRREARVT